MNDLYSWLDLVFMAACLVVGGSAGLVLAMILGRWVVPGRTEHADE